MIIGEQSKARDTTRNEVNQFHHQASSSGDEEFDPNTTKTTSNDKDNKDNDDAIEEGWVEEISSFDSLDLKEEVLRGIYGYGFEAPSAIQQRGIKPMLMGHDLIAQAHSGSGKTATFSIAVLQKIDPSTKGTQAMILAPTRELASQIYRVMSALSSFMPDVRIQAFIGGTNVREDIRLAGTGPHVVIGTPGRVQDLIKRRALSLRQIRLFVLDEADEMLAARGFHEQVGEIFGYMPEDVQSAIFSATMPLEIFEVTNKFMRNPIRILVKKGELTLQGIKQFYVALEREEWKLDTLCDIYEKLSITQSIIYCNTKRKVEWLTAEMRARDFTVAAIHGEMDQEERDRIMKEFIAGSSRVLITTDLLARGIDVQQVSVVINYDLPPNRENYIHRIGRSGRYGRRGLAINFLLRYDMKYMRDIESFYSTQINEMPSNFEDLIVNHQIV